MAAGSKSKLASIGKRISAEFALGYSEAQLLVGDLLFSLETLKEDVLESAKAKDWTEIRDAAGALQTLGHRLEEEDLEEVGKALEAIADAEKGDIGPIMADFDAFLSELTGGEPEVTLPEVKEGEDEIPKESDDTVFPGGG